MGLIKEVSTRTGAGSQKSGSRTHAISAKMTQPRLQVGQQIANMDAKGLGNFCQCFHSNFIFGAFYIPDVISCQIRLLGKLFLGKASLDSFGANGLTQYF